MDWTRFKTHGESHNHAFEVMCNLLFESWCNEEYGKDIQYFSTINGSGGDGGVEAYAVLKNKDIIGVQSKWFPKRLENNQFRQIKDSFETAIKVRPDLKYYIVCIPRDLTSQKKVSGEKISQNYEELSWNKICSDLKRSYPDVTIKLWNETEIQKELIKQQNIGYYKFWFENNIVFPSIIVENNNKAINGWAKTKYLSELYRHGAIHDAVASFLGTEEHLNKVYRKGIYLINKLEKLKRAFDDILNLLEEKSEVRKLIEDDIESVIKTIDNCKILLDSVKNGYKQSCTISYINFNLKFKTEKLLLDDIQCEKPVHYNAIVKLSDGIEEMINSFIFLASYENSNKKIILGDPGAGKTYGIVQESKRLIESKTHSPILVQARRYSRNDSWLSILEDALGLSQQWDEDELFAALEATAALRYQNRQNEKSVCPIPKCVICVDGIDEADDWRFWKERINECETYENRFKKIKFVFLSRPYVFERCTEEFRKDIIYIHGGDVAPYILFDEYIKFYQINISGNGQLKYLFKTPLALRLFCDIYKNKTITEYDDAISVITNLLKSDIYRLDDIFNSENNLYNCQYVRTLLIKLSGLFMNANMLDTSDIEKVCDKSLIEHLDDLLKLLENEGFLYSYCEQKEEFSDVNKFYCLGIQPLIDYLIAKKIKNKINKKEYVAGKYSYGMMQMLSLIMLEENGEIISKCKYLQLTNNDKFDLDCYSFANASMNAVKKFSNYLYDMMTTSVDNFRNIVNWVIIPVAKIKDHPMGAQLLDRFLKNNFEKPAIRDIWWSTPALYSNKSKSACKIEINTSSLDLSDDKYNGAPLLFLWRLSSLDNTVRFKSRLQLTKWGIENSSEFYKLLVYGSSINDEQILEDLFGIAYGIALSESIDNRYLELTSKFIIDDVTTNADKYKNVVISYFCTGVIQLAIKKKIISNDYITLFVGRYDINNVNLMTASKEALGAGRMRGYGPINYDLARYVLCVPLYKFFTKFEDSKDYHNDAEMLINRYGEQYEKENLLYDGLVISLAYNYLLSQGWSNEEFYEFKDQNIGVDRIIEKEYHPSTHGQMSKVMSIKEKYVWTARYRIEHFLVCILKWSDFDNSRYFINDYLEIESFINTYQDFIFSIYRNNKYMFLHKDIIAVANFNKYSLENINLWLVNTQLPCFQKWILDNENNTMLYSYSCMVNNDFGVKEDIFISSGIVAKDQFQALKDYVKFHVNSCYDAYNVADFHAYLKAFTYCTPQEICTIKGEMETRSLLDVENYDNYNPLLVYKSVIECRTEFSPEQGKSFYIPSKVIRRIIDIQYGNGYEYLNSLQEYVGKYTYYEEDWNNHQHCLIVDTNKLQTGLESNNYKMFWLFRVIKSPSSKAREAFGPKFEERFDKTYLVWFDKTECLYELLN